MIGKGGYSVIDLTFLTSADLITLRNGNSVSISKEQFESIKRSMLSDKPLYVHMLYPASGTYPYYEAFNALDSIDSLTENIEITVPYINGTILVNYTFASQTYSLSIPN